MNQQAGVIADDKIILWAKEKAALVKKEHS